MQTRRNPVQRSSPSAPKSADLQQLPSGAILAQSSRGPEVYRVVLGDEPSCECLGWQHHGHCYHVTQAAERYAASYTLPARAANVIAFRPRTAAANVLLYAD